MTRQPRISKNCSVCGASFRIKRQSNRKEDSHKCCSRTCYYRFNTGKNNPGWKGDDVGYYGIHAWMKRSLAKPKFCVNCKKKPPYDLANISQKYMRVPSDWEWLCRSCHMEKDGRTKELFLYKISSPPSGGNTFKGVSKAGSKWQSIIKVNGKNVYLGRYESPDSAAKIYNKVAKFVYGEMAWINPIPSDACALMAVAVHDSQPSS